MRSAKILCEYGFWCAKSLEPGMHTVVTIVNINNTGVLWLHQIEKHVMAAYRFRRRHKGKLNPALVKKHWQERRHFVTL